MNEIIANWTKLVLGVCMILVTIGFITGHVTTDDFKTIIGLGVGTHATLSGLSSMIAGPTANKDVTPADVMGEKR